MTTLAWNPTLALDDVVMDHTHEEFVDLLNAVGTAGPADIEATMRAFVEHTEQHFAEEERWMKESGFPPLGCHQNQHNMVLQVAREVCARVAKGETTLGEPFAKAVAEWFGDHVSVMDSILKQYMDMQGYTPVMQSLAEETRKKAG
ncbi:MAG: hemerythrin domain-containing protein [Proteobacteria bacterium]|nr:hemerythrin domain-containing protein [Pseudomonadota bacterium]